MSAITIDDDTWKEVYQGGPFVVPRKVCVHSLVGRLDLNSLTGRQSRAR